MSSSSFREALLARRVTLGTWIQINHPTSAEVLAELGFDWIGVDLEHSDIDHVSFAQVMRGMYGRGPVPLARVPTNGVMEIRKALDVGAQGVLVPLVSTAQEAERAVKAAKYPPRGIRGYSFSRMNKWGQDFDTYAQQANSEITVIVMIETKEGVQNIDAILDVDGVDGVFIGPYDMSGSYGIPGQTQDPIVQDACRQVVRACQQAKKAAGLHVVYATPEQVRRAVEDGFTLICLGVDIVFMREAARAARDLALSEVGRSAG